MFAHQNKRGWNIAIPQIMKRFQCFETISKERLGNFHLSWPFHCQILPRALSAIASRLMPYKELLSLPLYWNTTRKGHQWLPNHKSNGCFSDFVPDGSAASDPIDFFHSLKCSPLAALSWRCLCLSLLPSALSFCLFYPEGEAVWWCVKSMGLGWGRVLAL